MLLGKMEKKSKIPELFAHKSVKNDFMKMFVF